jgi:AAA+ ATPase superfamily predicted ATPase
LLIEWVAQTKGGLYTIADQSAPAVQRRYLAEALGGVLPGFADVTYSDWRTLLDRIARDARAGGWRGPLVIDEVPYLVAGSPELPSALQRWIDHEAAGAGLLTVVAGSSQRMMQGLVLGAEAPLFGRAQELLELQPLGPDCVSQLGLRQAVPAVDFLTAWGGIPRYWELAVDFGADITRSLEELVLDPLGPLHREPDRLLLEELPPAVELRPVLDAIGSGAHRLSEIAGRMGRPATALGRALQRLIELGLIKRETPFGLPEERSKRSLYRIADPFFRLWFRVIAPNRSRLLVAAAAERRTILRRHWEALVAESWEELCRRQLAALTGPRIGPGGWSTGQRWWHGTRPEWDVVAHAPAGAVLLGEAKWSRGGVSLDRITAWARALRSKPPPELPANMQDHPRFLALFVPSVARSVPREVEGVRVITGDSLLGLRQ